MRRRRLVTDRFTRDKPFSNTIMKKLILGVWLLPLLALTASAQYSIDWYKVAGGGGTSTGGTYQVSGTIGQPDASAAPMTGGNYSLTGGFWALYAVQTPGAHCSPSLIRAAPRPWSAWPLSVTGWTLQTNNNLATGTWGKYLGSVVNNSAAVPSKVGNLFFRLTQ